MASIVASSTASSATATLTLTVPRPSTTLQDGDWLICAVRQQSNLGGDITSPGFSRVGPTYVTGPGRGTGFFVKQVPTAAAETATEYVFTKPGTNSGRWAATMFVLRAGSGMELGSVVGFAPEYVGVTGTDRATSAYDIPNGTTGLEFMLGAGEFISNQSAALVETPAGFTTIQHVTSPGEVTASRTSLWVGYRTAPDPAGGGAINFVGSATDPNAHSVVISEVAVAPEEPEEPATLAVKVWNGTAEQTASATLWTGSTEAPVSDLLALPHRGYTVTQMDADIAAGKPVHWSHRGGSANWPEMTMRAFTNAVWHGAKCLEISVHRSSDGVWIMGHDSNLTRVTATDHVIVSTPSSTMLGLQVDTPTTGGVIGRLEDVLEAYPEFVLIVDNKPGSWWPEFLDLLETVPNAQDHIIVKFDGQWNSPVANLQAAKARGFKTAGYWYPNNYAANLPEKAEYTDYIGMQYDATPTQWADIFAYGKSVWGHVLQNQAQYNACAVAGVDIFQCADTKGLIPKINEV